jgi:hypothetical protein
MVVSPATRMRALSGRIHARWKTRRSSIASDWIDASVPVPVNGIA